MVDSCYFCRRTQSDLDRLNEEVRAKVYLSYFTNLRGQIDDEQRKIAFLQRLKDEEGGDPHFRIGAPQVFGDPGAYKKLMPWVDTLMEIAGAGAPRGELRGTIGELVETLLAQGHVRATELEAAMERMRAAFTSGTHSPLSLHEMTHTFPVEWPVGHVSSTWRSAQPGETEPLRREPGTPGALVDIRLHVCSICRKLTEPNRGP